MNPKTSQLMTFPKSTALFLICLVHVLAYAQENAAETDNPSQINNLDELQAIDAGTPGTAGQEEPEIPLEIEAESPYLPEIATDDETTQEAFDLGLEDPATEGDNAGEELPLDRLELRSTYRNYMNAKQYPEAVDTAVLALRLTEEVLGTDNVELVPVLNELGMALLFTRQPEIAVQHFERSVDLIETNNGIFAPDLVNPLTGMGIANQQMENHSGAINHFLRSQHVIHRDQGVTDLNQVNIMGMLTQSLLAEDRFTDAESVQKAILKLHKMNYGAESGRIARPMMALANWQRRYGLLTNSRYLYRSSIELRLDFLDPGSEEMKPVLEKLGLRYFDVMAP